MKNIRLIIIGSSLMLALWMTASFMAQPELPTRATSKSIVESVLSEETIENIDTVDQLSEQVSEPLAQVK